MAGSEEESSWETQQRTENGGKSRRDEQETREPCPVLASEPYGTALLRVYSSAAATLESYELSDP